MAEGIANLRDLNAIGLIGIVSVIEIIDIRNKRTESMNVAGIGTKKGAGKMIEDQKDQIVKEVKSEKEKDQKDLDGVSEEKTDQKADQKASVHPNEMLKKQLQQDGLQQAAEFSKQQAASVSVSSSQTSIGLRVVSSSLNQALVIDGQKPQEAKEKSIEDKSNSLFDFEKVARNVLKFVGGVIRGAANGGASEEKLNGLFSQAREGVSRGFAMAEKDLAGFMNEEIEQGMTKSRDLIDTGINDLETDIFGRQQPNAVTLSPLNTVAASDEKSGSLLIRTKDGDEVSFSFESLRSFQASQQLNVQAQASQEQAGGSGEQGENNFSALYQQQTSYQYYERSGISFSLKGELDEDELESIADLVGQVQDLADTFYSGDIDKAFEEALSLGFDDKELVLSLIHI